MKLAFLLSGENPELAKWEVFRCLGVENKAAEVHGNLLIVNVEKFSQKDVERLGMSHEASLIIAECNLEELEDTFREIAAEHEGSGCVRVKRLRRDVDRMKLERELGKYLSVVDLTNPDVIYRVYVSDKCYISKMIFRQNKKQFSERDPNKRPFFMPSVVLPKLARTLVNLSGVREGEKLLDPMCGTGSFVIEALVMGIDAVGMDLFWKIARGCKRNLEFYGLRGDVVMGDVRKMPFRDKTFKAVVTDYPYLRSTRSVCEIEELYERSVEEIARVGENAVLVTNIDVERFLEGRMRVVKKFMWRVHGTLTRRIYLCESES